MNNNDYAIKVTNVSKQYKIYSNPKDRLKQFFVKDNKKLFQEFWALKDISFHVKKGESVGIIGRNGSGKSTLLQIISGVLKPTIGSVEVNGRIAALLELGSGFNPEFTGRENVFLNGRLLGITRAEMEKKFDNIVEFADIGDFIDQPVKLYSSGMFVRLAFAVQALIEPEILIVDEALSVGDEKFQRKCFAYIDKLKKSGSAILIVSHSTGMIEKFTDRCILLESGEMHGNRESKYIIDQYHALLYSSESAYLKMLNEKLQKESEVAAEQIEIEIPANQEEDSQGDVKIIDEVSNRVYEKKHEEKDDFNGKAIIKDICIKDIDGNNKELFNAREDFKVQFDVDMTKDVSIMQAGIRLRTVEGIEVFGTSTEYFRISPDNLRKGQKIRLSFNMKGNLCEGSYFLSVAIAEKISESEMVYIDKRSDALMLKVKQFELEGTGTANLMPEIEYDILS